jgi:hypothetical protein
LKRASSEVTVTDGQAAGWVNFTLTSPVALAAGDYWLGYIAGTNTNTAQYGSDSVSNNRKYHGTPYAGGPLDPFGSADGTDNFQVDIYASWVDASVDGANLGRDRFRARTRIRPA